MLTLSQKHGTMLAANNNNTRLCRMIQAIITDFDGVIRHWQNDQTAQVEAQCKLPAGTLSSLCFDPELLLPAITGKVSFEQWQDNAKAKIQKIYGLGVAEHYIEAWQRNGYRIDHDLIMKYRDYFPDAHVILATNATSRLPQELRDANLNSSFYQVFNSSAMGVAKPQKQFFSALLMSLGLSAKQTLFIDDSIGNVQSAKQLGMNAVHYDSRTQVLSQLEHLSLQYSMLAM